MLRLPPPIWTMAFLGLTAAISWGFDLPATWPPHHEAVGITIFFTACLLPVWAYIVFRRAGTEIDPVSETNRALITDGPYGFTRNPMYLGLVVAAFGMAIWAGWPLMLAAPALAFATVQLVHVPFEEAKMRRQFGAAYDAYAARVRRWV